MTNTIRGYKVIIRRPKDGLRTVYLGEARSRFLRSLIPEILQKIRALPSSERYRNGEKIKFRRLIYIDSFDKTILLFLK